MVSVLDWTAAVRGPHWLDPKCFIHLVASGISLFKEDVDVQKMRRVVVDCNAERIAQLRAQVRDLGKLSANYAFVSSAEGVREFFYYNVGRLDGYRFLEGNDLHLPNLRLEYRRSIMTRGVCDLIEFDRLKFLYSGPKLLVCIETPEVEYEIVQSLIDADSSGSIAGFLVRVGFPEDSRSSDTESALWSLLERSQFRCVRHVENYCGSSILWVMAGRADVGTLEWNSDNAKLNENSVFSPNFMRRAEAVRPERRERSGSLAESAKGRSPQLLDTPDWDRKTSLPLLIESKSLPRSGLHFLVSAFQRVFEDRFSFCEYYHEPGCCRRSPCAIAVEGQRLAPKGVSTGLRLIKSHDFSLRDPVEPPTSGVSRFVLLRSPLMILTSWWALDEIHRHRDILAERGLGVQMIYFRHDKKVVALAQSVVQENWISVPSGYFEDWLGKRRAFILAFLQKWNANTADHLVDYDEIPSFLIDYLCSRESSMTEKEQFAFHRFKDELAGSFKVRSEPFSSDIDGVRDTLLGRRDRFLEVSNELEQAYWTARGRNH